MKYLLTLGCAVASASLSLLVSQTQAATAPSPATVTVMTPDVVSKYDSVRPEADYIKRVVMVPMREDLVTLFDRSELQKYLTEQELPAVRGERY